MWVDEPNNERDIELCKERAKIMKEQNSRYVYITKEMSFEDVVNQLGG